MRISRCVRTETVVVCLFSSALHVLLRSPSFAGGLVVPRKFVVMTESEGKDWNNALEACDSLNMTLATVDFYAFTFLVSQSLYREFQINADGHFWIGLHHLNPRNETSAIAEYRWTDQCQANRWSLWDDGYPSNASEEDYCVYAANTTLRWRTDRCSAGHQYMCQRKERRCHYNQTHAGCNLYITATERRTVINGSPADCRLLCETSYTAHRGLPCWGFTMTTTGCVLHYQTSQPNCDVSHHQTYPAFFRTCFQVFYAEGPKAIVNPVDTDRDIPDVKECGPVAKPEESSKPTQSTDQPEASTKYIETRATATACSTAQPATEKPTEAAALITHSQDRTVKPNWSPPQAQCGCKCDATRRNKTSVLEAVKVTQLDLAVDVKLLSSVRRKKGSAHDPRASSRSVAYIGVIFVAVVMSVVMVPDLVTLARHIRHGVPLSRLRPRRRPCYIP